MERRSQYNSYSKTRRSHATRHRVTYGGRDKERSPVLRLDCTKDALKHASGIYLQAKRALGISQKEIPQLRDLSKRLEKETRMHLVPAEGPLPYRTFYT